MSRVAAMVSSFHFLSDILIMGTDRPACSVSEKRSQLMDRKNYKLTRKIKKIIINIEKIFNFTL